MRAASLSRSSPGATPEVFAAFARTHGLSLTSRVGYAAPRDVLHPPGESDQYAVVTVRRGDHPVELPLVFLQPLGTREPVTLADVLWWLAGDARALDDAAYDLDTWARAHDYAVTDPATAALYTYHVEMTRTLRALLGEDAYRALLALAPAPMR